MKLDDFEKYGVKSRKQFESALVVFYCIVGGAALLSSYFLLSTLIPS